MSPKIKPVPEPAYVPPRYLTAVELAKWFSGRVDNYSHGRLSATFRPEFDGLITGVSTDPTFGHEVTSTTAAATCLCCFSLVVDSWWVQHVEYHERRGEEPSE